MLLSMKLSIVTQSYLDYRTHGWSESTVKNDVKVLRKLINHVGDIEVANISPEMMDEFLSSKPMNPSPSTYNLYFSGLRNFMKWCRERKHMDHDPLVGQRIKPKPEVEQLRIPMEKFPALLAEAKKPRDRMIICIGLYLMVRESEARSIQLKHINLTEGWIQITVHKDPAKKIDRMPISPELDAELRTYLTWYAQQHGKLEDDWYLIPQYRFTNRWQEQEMNPTQGLGPGGMARPIQRIVASLGYPTRRVGMHTLRRSAAAAVFLEKKRLGYDGALRQVAAWLHHKNQRTSEIYLGMDIDRNQRDKEAREAPLYPSLQSENVVNMQKRGVA